MSILDTLKIKCRKCGMGLGGHARFCSDCGTRREGRISPYGSGKPPIHEAFEEVFGKGNGHLVLQVMNKMKLKPGTQLPPVKYCPECGESIPELQT